jgi:hypothetical protein
MFIDSIASSRRGSPFLRSYIRHAINANVLLKQNCIGENTTFDTWTKRLWFSQKKDLWLIGSLEVYPQLVFASFSEWTKEILSEQTEKSINKKKSGGADELPDKIDLIKTGGGAKPGADFQPGGADVLPYRIDPIKSSWGAKPGADFQPSSTNQPARLGRHT